MLYNSEEGNNINDERSIIVLNFYNAFERAKKKYESLLAKSPENQTLSPLSQGKLKNQNALEDFLTVNNHFPIEFTFIVCKSLFPEEVGNLETSTTNAEYPSEIWFFDKKYLTDLFTESDFVEQFRYFLLHISKKITFEFNILCIATESAKQKFGTDSENIGIKEILRNQFADFSKDHHTLPTFYDNKFRYLNFILANFLLTQHISV